ncbi:MAG: hypothetical protein HYY48_08205 [Gammaproteobacteria bacterium]|nr:hypothetical protein [Gammaproteobacteria bacterium]
MVILRATVKVLRSLPESAAEDDRSDTALGDWYVNRLVVDRRPLLLCVSSTSLLSILAPARDVRSLPQRFPGIVADRLRRFGIPLESIESELNAMHEVRVGRTQDRSDLGTMVDFAKAVPYYLPINGWDATTLRDAEDRLAKTPCRVVGRFKDVIFPEKTTPELLRGKWASSRKAPVLKLVQKPPRQA